MERVSLHLGVLGMVAGRVERGNFQGGVVVAVDTHTDPGVDSLDEEVVPVVERVEAPGSSIAPCLDSTRPQLG